MIRHLAMAGSALAFAPLVFALTTNGHISGQKSGKKPLVELPSAPVPSPTPTPTPTPAPTAGPVDVAPAAPLVTNLAPLDISTMRLWDYSQPWHASEWGNAFSDTPWKYDHVKRSVAPSTDVVFVLDSLGAPELKGDGGLAKTAGTWEAEVTLPSLRSGLCTAPLWLFNDQTSDEIDFETVGNKGLQMTIHSTNTGQHQQFAAPLIVGDFSGKRIRFGIKTDLVGGTIEMRMDDKLVYTFRRSATPGAFPRTALKPVISMWTAKGGLGWAEGWLGRWAPLAPGEKLTMTVHGYRYTPTP